MSYWTTQYKHAEIARTQNKRQERLHQLEFAGRHGIKDVHRYNMQAVEHEQRLIERELERIRKGMVRRPLQHNALSYLGNLAILAKRHVSKRRQENATDKDKNVKESAPVLDIDNGLFRAIVPEPVNLYECKASIPDHLTPRGRVNGVEIDPAPTDAVISSTNRQAGDTSDIDCGPSQTVNTHTPITGGREFDFDQSIHHPDQGGLQNGVPVPEDQRLKRRPLDLAELASLDMKSVKTDVSRRLSTEKKEVAAPNSSRDAKPDENELTSIQEEAKPKEKTRRVSRAKAPAADAHKKAMDFDPEHYNPDGSLRKIHAMPNSDKTWEQAKKARYIRCKETADKERELTVEEIFEG